MAIRSCCWERSKRRHSDALHVARTDLPGRPRGSMAYQRPAQLLTPLLGMAMALLVTMTSSSCCSLLQAQAITDAADKAALSAFNGEVKKAMGGTGVASWFAGAGGAGDPCDDGFSGVSCDNSNPRRILDINLVGSQLSADSIAALAQLPFLRNLLLANNKFKGSIPADLSKRTRLNAVNLQNNLFSGQLPDLFGSSVKRINFAQNQLQGPIPPGFGNMTQLVSLDLGHNNLSGSIPPNVTLQLTKLQVLNLNNNKLTGKIPFLGNLRVQTLSLHHNPFTPGRMPSELSLLTGLTGELDLSAMNLIGRLGDLSALAGVTDLVMDDNRMKGFFDPDLLPQGSLGFISVANNKFSGPLTERIAVALANPLYSMRSCGVIVANNSFEGPLPRNLSNIFQAFVLDFSNNKFTGVVPPKYSGMFQLTRIYVQGNNLQGPIPSFFSDRISFVELDFSSNQMSGSLPATMSLLSELRVFRAASNQFSRNVPAFFSTLTKLTQIDLSSNNFVGALPSLPSAKIVTLNRNWFSGKFNPALFPVNNLLAVRTNCLQRAGCTGTVAACFWTQTQRSLAACTKYCSAQTAPPIGPCSGFGVCTLSNKKYGCTCNSGYTAGSAFTCVKGRKKITKRNTKKRQRKLLKS